jgi:hypothetical protein
VEYDETPRCAARAPARFRGSRRRARAGRAGRPQHRRRARTASSRTTSPPFSFVPRSRAGIAPNEGDRSRPTRRASRSTRPIQRGARGSAARAVRTGFGLPRSAASAQGCGDIAPAARAAARARRRRSRGAPPSSSHADTLFSPSARAPIATASGGTQ